MAHIDLVCLDCKHAFQVVTRLALQEKQRHCPTCGSKNLRQTLASYVRNGPLSAPTCGAPDRTTYG